MKRYAVAAALAAIVVGTLALAAPAAAAEPDASALDGFRVEALLGYEGEDGSGITYGVGAGFDVAAGPLLFGIEGEAMDSGAEECVIDPISSSCSRAGRDLYLGARAGIAFGRANLAYVKAGFSDYRIDVDYTPNGGPTQEFVDERDGFRAGAGVQVGIGSHLYGKAEYRYTTYQSGFEKHQGVIGLGYRF